MGVAPQRWSTPSPVRLLGVVGLLGAAAVSAASCVTDDDTAAASSGWGGFDEDVDPAALEEFAGKSDGDPCRDHPGGTLVGDDLLLIVNKEELRQLRRDWRPADLVPIDGSSMMPGRDGVVRMAALTAFYELAEAARTEAGLQLGVRSAYRSFETQCLTFNYKVEQYGYDHAVQYSARPGRSEHQLGTAIDITSAALGWDLTQSMGESAEGIWLVQNAHRFGFGLSYPLGYEQLTGYGYEPWHWRYIGREAALEMAAHELRLIDYLLACEAGSAGLTCPREEPPVVEPNAGWIGGACVGSGDCVSIGTGASCLLAGYPDGHCTLPCTYTCPDREGANAQTFCVVDPADAAVGTCHSRCDTILFPATGCREGYACQQASRPNDAGSAMVCLPSAP